MLNLLRSDFYKLRKTKSYFVCLILCIGLAVASILISHFSYTTSGEALPDGFSGYLAETFSITTILFASIVVPLFVASEFGFGTIKNTASKGFRRFHIYFSKLIVSCVVTLSYMIAYSASATITGTILWGFGATDGAYWTEIGKIIGLELLLHLAFTAVFVLISTLIRQSGGAIAISICVISFFSTMVQLGEMILNYIFKTQLSLLNYLISTNISAVAQGTLTTDLIVRALVVGCLYLVASTAIGILVFQKRDIK